MTKIIFMDIKQNVLPNQTLKKGLIKKNDYFLKILNKLLKKKKQLINTSQQKLSIIKFKPKIVVFNILDNSKNKNLSISILEIKISILIIEEINITIICIDIYYIACKLKKS